ncbi:cellulase family glycosylhydrolase [candidate division KSB1 bacterium]|nr:cellulase family glycosylhydrolase [candidate division KSB1 bacterium]
MKRTKRIYSLTLINLILVILLQSCSNQEPLQLHPQNPHYFLFKGEPTILVGSTEHYGAVMNLDFNYARYLETLKNDKLNLTRTFSGIYVEHPGAFNISRNTLAPAPDRYICPWKRSAEPGYQNGGNKFDLNQWDENYFHRLKDFVQQADKNGVVVEMTLFSSIYSDTQWNLCPLNPVNNINNLDKISWQEFLSLKHPNYLIYQEKMVRKIVEELKDFDNLYYEICNEPYITGNLSEWEAFIANIIQNAEKNFDKKHLISQNIQNGFKLIENPNPAVSIFNFHYAKIATVTQNYALNKPIGDNETGFKGTSDAPYRIEAWNFMLSGGSLFNHLDYSFAVGYEDGTFQYPESQPGGGNPQLRKQFALIKDYLDQSGFITSKLDTNLVDAISPTSFDAVWMDHGKDGAYSVYISRKNLNMNTNFSVRWQGYLIPPATSAYQLTTLTDDGIRIWIDDQLLIQNWTNHAPTRDSCLITLQKGRKHKIRAEFYQAEGGLVCQLFWKNEGTKEKIISENYFLGIDQKTPGLNYELYHALELTQKVKSGIAPLIDLRDQKLDSLYIYQEKVDTVYLALKLRSGKYQIDWINPETGVTFNSSKVNHADKTIKISCPADFIDLLMKIKPLN